MAPKLIGTHPAIREIRRALLTLAHCRAHILIIGEPGVGRALVARMIHALSAERQCQLRSLNFALVTEREQRLSLFGSEPPEASIELQGLLRIQNNGFAEKYRMRPAACSGASG